MAVGAKWDDDGGNNRGAVWILFMNANGTVKSHQLINSTNGGLSGPLDDTDNFGSGVAGVGDVDGDGNEDLIASSAFGDIGGNTVGEVYLIYLNLDGTVKDEVLINSQVGGLTGPIDNADLFGYSISNIGDRNGDGKMNIAVGTRNDDDGGSNRGAIYLLDLSINAQCDDQNDCTENDQYNENCECVGTLIDSDNDGVCDLDDLCPNGDDTIDSDGDGIPDACDDYNGNCGNSTYINSGYFVYGSSSATSKRREWDGQMLGVQIEGINHGTPFHYLRSASAPTRDEDIFVGINSNFNINGEIRIGDIWSALPFNPLINLGSGLDYWQVDVAYEQISGDALLVWDNATNGSSGLSYRIWDGSNWTEESTITLPIAENPESIHLASNPNSDELILVVSTGTSDKTFAIIWDGNSWGSSTILNSALGSHFATNNDVAYEQLSGTAIAVFYPNSGSNLSYKSWAGSSWGSVSSIPAPEGIISEPAIVKLASAKNSDQIVLGVMTDALDVWFAIWDGSSWGSHLIATTNAESRTQYSLATAFETLSSEVMVAYAVKDSTKVKYRTWSGLDWSVEKDGPDFGFVPRTLEFYPNPDSSSNEIILGGHNTSSQPHFAHWNGTTWSEAIQVTSSAGISRRQPFTFVWTKNDDISCDDNNACTENDQYNYLCECVGSLIDSDGDGICDSEDRCPGADDNVDTDQDGIPDACDVTNGNCNLNAPCDDQNPCTENDHDFTRNSLKCCSKRILCSAFCISGSN